MKLKPGLFWNHPSRDMQVYKMSTPLNSWAHPEEGDHPEAPPMRWTLGMYFEMAVAKFELTIRGYPGRLGMMNSAFKMMISAFKMMKFLSGEAPPNLLHASLVHLAIDRMTGKPFIDLSIAGMFY